MDIKSHITATQPNYVLSLQAEANDAMLTGIFLVPQGAEFSGAEIRPIFKWDLGDFGNLPLTCQLVVFLLSFFFPCRFSHFYAML